MKCDISIEEELKRTLVLFHIQLSRNQQQKQTMEISDCLQHSLISKIISEHDLQSMIHRLYEATATLLVPI